MSLFRVYIATIWGSIIQISNLPQDRCRRGGIRIVGHKHKMVVTRAEAWRR